MYRSNRWGYMGKNVENYYKSSGWKKNDQDVYLDEAVNHLKIRVGASYDSKSRELVRKELLDQRNNQFRALFDCASGPIHFKEYLEYSRGYHTRYCVDFSEDALNTARENLINDGQPNVITLCGDFLTMSIDSNCCDSAISLHTLYHIDIDKQKDFVLKLIDVVRPGGRVLIVYSNPLSARSILSLPYSFILYILLKCKNIFLKKKIEEFYFRRHNLCWWIWAKKHGDVKIITYRLLTPQFENLFIPDNLIGKYIYYFISYLEKFRFSKYIADYYMVVIDKK